MKTPAPPEVPPEAPPKPKTHPALDKIVLLLVSGIGQADLENACVMKLGVEPQDVSAVIAEARRRLTRAAEYNRDEQLGTAITRMNDIYARAIRASDIKTALTAQREINKLLDLYTEAAKPAGSEDSDEGEGDGVAAELAAIRGHLLPLALAADSYPLREHARIAAELIREHRSRQVKDDAWPAQ